MERTNTIRGPLWTDFAHGGGHPRHAPRRRRRIRTCAVVLAGISQARCGVSDTVSRPYEPSCAERRYDSEPGTDADWAQLEQELAPTREVRTLGSWSDGRQHSQVRSTYTIVRQGLTAYRLADDQPTTWDRDGTTVDCPERVLEAVAVATVSVDGAKFTGEVPFVVGGPASVGLAVSGQAGAEFGIPNPAMAFRLDASGRMSGRLHSLAESDTGGQPTASMTFSE